MLLVFVEIEPVDAPPALARELVDACSRAIYRGTCSLGDGDPNETPTALATVRWDGARERVAHIEVGTSRGDEPGWASKTLEFKGSDARAERWKSVGLTIATLVGEFAPAREEPGEEREAAHPSDASSTAPVTGDRVSNAPAPVERRSKTAAREEEAEEPTAEGDEKDTGVREGRGAATGVDSRPFWIDLGASAGRAFSDGGARLGGWAGIGVNPIGSPLFGRLSVALAFSPSTREGLTARWTTTSLGGGAVLRWAEARLRVEPRIALTLDHLTVTATNDAGLADTGMQLGFGGQLGSALVLETGWLCPVLGLEGYWLTATTRIRVRDREVESVPAVGWVAQAAARLFL